MTTITQHPHTQKSPTVSDKGKTITLCGTVYKIRRMKQFSFVILQTGDALIQCIAENMLLQDIPAGLKEQSHVEITGNVIENRTVHAGFEIRILTLRMLSVPHDPLPLVINGRETPPLETELAYRTASLRREETRSIFRIASALSEGCADFFRQNGFVSVHTPKICAGTAESGAGVFAVDYFGREAFLATSPQLYKQMMIGVFPRVYEIAPVFRAEPHDTARHLNEYTGIDCEVGYITDVVSLMEIACAMLSHTFSYVKMHASDALERLSVVLPEADSIPALPFSAAKEILKEQAPAAYTDTDDLTPPEEKAISAYAKATFGSDLLFVTAYPTAKRPFYTLENAENPAVTESFDILFRGMEITTGGLRIHDFDAQCEKMRRKNVNPASFSDYLSAHRYGLPPHGGYGFGLERLTAALCGYENVRHASLFPRDIRRLTP